MVINFKAVNYSRGNTMIDTSDKLESTIRIKYRFIKKAAESFGFKGSQNYQRFRNTILGSSKDYQVILVLLKHFPKLDTNALWGLDKKALINLAKDTTHNS